MGGRTRPVNEESEEGQLVTVVLTVGVVPSSGNYFLRCVKGFAVRLYNIAFQQCANISLFC